MKKITVLLVLLGFIASCGNFDNGELTGVQGRGDWFEKEPYGMVFVPMGSFNMGPSDENSTWTMDAQSKTVSVDAFWMDQTEITNNEYRQFVFYVRDSIKRRLLGANIDEFVIAEDEFGNEIDPPQLNWETEIDMQDEEQREILEELFLRQEERFYNAKEIDSRKLNYEYFWVDLLQAGQKKNRYNFETQSYEGQFVNQSGEVIPVEDRSAFIVREKINVYPDTLCWISDFTYSFSDPYATNYFSHPAYDNYPVLGVNWKQARAFSIWRTQKMNDFLKGNGEYRVHDYRLPLESEWEYAARGDLDLNPYPWGGPYTRNNEGCFLANFKPLRGNYVDDGGMITTPVASYNPNQYMLYDMSGNVAEWCENAYDESTYNITHDFNPNYKYQAKPDDPSALKRKVVRGGSWKDVGYFLQCGSRTYEYQDTSKSFIGFRNVRSYLGAN